MRIASWNINGVRARIDYIRHWLIAREPDLVGFQELKALDEVFPHEPFNELGYTVYTHGQKGWNGVALASRTELEVSCRGLSGQEDNGARLITCDMGDFDYSTVYCPNGKTVEHADYEMKLNWFESLVSYCEGILSEGKALLIGGDYNICATAQDSHLGEKGEGQIFHTAREREVLGNLFDLGLIDLFRDKYPQSNSFSWWDFRGGAFQRNLGLRIDLMLGTQAIANRVEDVVIDRDFRKKIEGLTPSDHAPVYVDLNW